MLQMEQRLKRVRSCFPILIAHKDYYCCLQEIGPVTVSDFNRASLMARLLSADPSQIIAAVGFVVRTLFLLTCNLSLD